MAFKEVSDLSADVTISLGGVNKKTGKANPKSVEGYYLGKREVADKKKKSGKSYIYFFQTPKGNIGVWGKTDLDRKLGAIQVGVMTRASFDRMVPTPNGEMYKYKVEFDPDNSVEVVEGSQANSGSLASVDSGSIDEADELLATEDEETEEEAYSEPIARPAQLSAQERQAKVAALLKNKR